MANFKRLVKQLQAEKQQLEKQVAQIANAIDVLGSMDGRRGPARKVGRPASRPVRHMSLAARRRIAAAQRARWAKLKAQRPKRAVK